MTTTLPQNLRQKAADSERGHICVYCRESSDSAMPHTNCELWHDIKFSADWLDGLGYYN